MAQQKDAKQALANELEGEEEETERGNWSNKLDFLLSCLGYAVGLGNVWRFPALCYKNGGGAFLIPYAIFLFVAGMPLFFMELGIGQFSSLGPVEAFGHLCPILQGIGVGMVIISAIVCIYYNMIIAWTLFYTFASFQKVLPWSNCNFKGSTSACYDYRLAEKCTIDGGLFFENYCYNETEAALYSITNETIANATRNTPSQEYFNNFVLGKSAGIEDMGKQRWQLVLCLLGAWVLVFFCLIKGVKSSGKVVYFTALFPYVVLTILLIRGATLPGARQGIEFYLIPDWQKLREASVWGDAAGQIFFSLGPAWGGLITLASYNQFHNNCYRDMLIVSLGNCGTSVYAGFAIFSILGFMAHDLNLPVGEVVDSGPGLAFVAYPEAITRLPVSPLWSFLFFFMLITLGLDSQFTMMETVTTAIMDHFTKLRKHKAAVLAAVCILWFILGLTLTCEGGVYVLELINGYAAGWSLMILALLELLIIGWIYDYPNCLNPSRILETHRYALNIEKMLYRKPYLFWQIMWKFVTPVALAFILLFNWIKHVPLTYGDYTYPGWANIVGWLMALASVIMVPIGAVVNIIKNKSGSIFSLFRATPEWAPAAELRQGNKIIYHDSAELKQKEKLANAAYINPVDPIAYYNPPPFNIRL